MLNDFFTRSYGLRRKELEARILEGSLPVAIRIADDLVLLHGQTRSTQSVLSPRYHALKAICHVPLALYLDLARFLDAPLDAPDLERLRALLHELEGTDTDPAARPILEAARAELLATLELGQVRASSLTRLERDTRAPIRACIELACRDELSTLHEIVMKWADRFEATDWQNLRIVVCAGHQARYRQISKQYFQRLLHEHSGVEQQVLYAENARSEEEALQLLSAHLLDRDLAAFFLDSPLALQQDVLGNAAQRVLNEIFRES